MNMNTMELKQAMTKALPKSLLTDLPLRRSDASVFKGLFDSTYEFCLLHLGQEDEARKLGVRMSQWMSPGSSKAGRMPDDIKDVVRDHVTGRLREDIDIDDYMRAFEAALSRVRPDRFRVRFTHVKQTDLMNLKLTEQVVIVSKSASRLMRPSILGPLFRKIISDAWGVETVPVVILLMSDEQGERLRNILVNWIFGEQQIIGADMDEVRIRELIKNGEQKGHIRIVSDPILVGQYEGPNPLTLRFHPGSIVGYRHGVPTSLEPSDTDLEHVNDLVSGLEARGIISGTGGVRRKDASRSVELASII